MALASNTENIRYNGTGRVYMAAVGGAGLEELGEMDGLNFSVDISTEQLKSTRHAARAVILETETDRTAKINFGMREMSAENLKMALLGSAVNTDNQAAGNIYQNAPTFLDDQFIDLGHLDVFITKISGVITGAIAVGDTVTGATSGATGKVAFVGSGFIELVNVSGTFAAGEQVEVDVSNYLTASGVEKLEDVCVTDATGATRRAQGTDYSLDPDYGYLRKLSDGSIVAGDVVSYDYEALDRKYLWGLSAGSVEKKLIFVSDRDDIGPRQRWTFHKVKLNLNGDFPLIGDAAAVLSVSATVLADTSQPSGQEYYKVEMM